MTKAGGAARPAASWRVALGRATRAITFRRLEAVSFTHSAVYIALLACAFILGKPEPETFGLGLAHGLLWIGMSVVCIGAARARVLPFWLAVTVAVLGGLGPFAGTIGFVLAERSRTRRDSGSAAFTTR
ncbi:MAG: hypothetical protein ACR2IP_14155 [Solirubrobacteraceae bacterium]